MLDAGLTAYLYLYVQNSSAGRSISKCELGDLKVKKIRRVSLKLALLRIKCVSLV